MSPPSSGSSACDKQRIKMETVPYSITEQTAQSAAATSQRRFGKARRSRSVPAAMTAGPPRLSVMALGTMSRWRSPAQARPSLYTSTVPCWAPASSTLLWPSLRARPYLLAGMDSLSSSRTVRLQGRSGQAPSRTRASSTTPSLLLRWPRTLASVRRRPGRPRRRRRRAPRPRSLNRRVSRRRRARRPRLSRAAPCSRRAVTRATLASSGRSSLQARAAPRAGHLPVAPPGRGSAAVTCRVT